MIDIDALKRDKRPQSAGVVHALIDRLEAAESDALEQARLNGMGASREAALMAKLEAAEKDIALKERIIDSLGSELNAVANERDALLAKIEAMEQQEPVAWLHETRRDSGAQPAPSEKDEPIRKAWARFSNALHRSPDAPYPGMSEAFEKHFSQSFTDREWRAESATWAAAWKAAKRHEAQAQPAPSVPTGWKLVPIDPTRNMLDIMDLGSNMLYRYRALLAAAPKPNTQGEEK